VLAGIAASIGTVDDPYHNALEETTIGLFNTEAVLPAIHARIRTELFENSLWATARARTKVSAAEEPNPSRRQAKLREPTYGHIELSSTLSCVQRCSALRETLPYDFASSNPYKDTNAYRKSKNCLDV
jgi:hypothetical protein